MEMKRLIILGLLIFIGTSRAQWLTNFSINTAYDNNPFRLPSSEESWITNLNLGVQHNFNSVSISYLSGYTRFEQIHERNFFWHQLAFFGSSGSTKWGLYADQRLNGNEFQLYDYLIYTAYLNHSLQLFGFNLFLDSHLFLNTYSDLPEIDNFEITSFFKLNKSFSTRTTLIVGSKLLFKRYLNSTSTATEFIDSGSGKGKGMNSGGGAYFIYSEIEAPSATQLQSFFRVAQSITSTTGIALQVQNQIMLTGSSRFISGLSNGYSEESQIFDDPIGYESQGIGTELTQLIAAGFYLRGAFYLTHKKYQIQGIYLDPEIYDDSKLREDTFKIGWLRIEKVMPIRFPADGSLTLRLIYQYTDNSSNSFWYNYQNQFTALDLEFQF